MTSRPVGLVAAALLTLGLAMPAAAIPDPDPADVTAQLSIEKTASETTVEPGDDLIYTIEIGCSAISDVGCRDAITTDVVPEPLEIVDVTPAGPNDAPEPVVDGQNVTVTWTEQLAADGSIGMLDNTTSQVEIAVHVPEDVPYDYDGATLTNNATAESTNALDVSDSADVTINVPLDLETAATKSFTPETALAAAGTPVVADLGGSNDSNATVDTLTIQDPVDPTAVPNPFTYLGFTGFGTVAPPAGTTSTTYEVYVDGAWVAAPGGTLPDGVDPADVEGTRVTFTGEIPPGATGSVELDLATTDEAAAVTDDTAVTNDVQSEVALDGDTATDTASADFNLQANDVSVAASKSFDPSLVIAGESSTATIGGTNTSPFPIDSMTITEPATGSFPAEYTFGGFTTGITYPEGATSGTVIYQPSGEEVPFSDGGIPDAPTGGADSVTSFQLVFEGDIQAGAEASAGASFDVDTDAATPGLPDTVNNEVGVEGENDGATGDATADDDLYIYDEVIEPYVDKQVRPAQILANPGEIVTVTLQGGTTERPDPPDTTTGSTGSADQIVIQDPLDPVEPNAWWNAFDLDSITQTPIPADATLTVEYYDTTTGEWETLDGPIAGPTIYSYDVPDSISDVAGGVRFVYDYTGDDAGFPPGTDLAPNFTSSLRDTGRYDGETPPYNNDDPGQPNTLIPNCAQTDASSPTAGVPDGSAAMDPADCPEIEIIPTNGEGAGDLIDKSFGTSSSGGNKSVIARSGDTIPSTLSWSTGGYSNFETVTVTDVSDPTIPVADSVYDAFNLTRIGAITEATDPYIEYDEVTSVQLWNGTTWTEATNSTCDTGGCLGQMPAIDLTADEQGSTLAVRLIFAERPDRADVIEGDLDAPPVGSGVARSFGNDRPITLVWQVRDTKRSDGSAALGDDTYNLAPQEGVVRNTVNATGDPIDPTADPISDNAQDDVVITDVPITTTTEKDWLGGPLAIPSPGTPEDQYPVSRLRVRTTNTTPAKVDQLQITDPGGSTPTDPFEYVRLEDVAAINVPDGTQTTTVTLTCPDGSTEVLTRQEALDLTPATMPCDVVGVQVLFDGRIVAGGVGAIALDVQLRATERTSGDPVTVDDSPIANEAQGIVADVAPIGACPPPADARYACDQADATIEIVAPTFDINAGKSISPAVQDEGDFSPVTVTITARNSGSARPYLDTLTDDDPTFWNAVDLLQMDPAWVLPEPIEFVQACYLTGGDFTETNVEDDTVGGDWTCQDVPGGGPPFEPGVDLTLDQARAFIDSAPVGQIHGLRFNFMANDEIGWQNPANPLIQVPFQVERRTDLRTGGPVPTNRSDQEPAPGETDAGVFVDTVEADGESVLVGPDTRLDADDTADAPYTHEHLTVGVEVDKTPTGQVPPGEVIPFTLTYTNTGEAALTNPVFTDVIPTDADGPQLILDPESDPAIVSPYSFELTGDVPEPPNGDPLPTDPDDITITQDPAAPADPETITFAMPDGTVLEPGQTYTITIELVLRPGLTPDDLVTNTDTVIADEPFDPDACAPNYDADTGECWDETTVSPVRVASLSTVKTVKADVPVDEPGIPEVYLDRSVIPAGVDLPDDYCDTAADAAGFYRSPCVPVTYPGDTESWRYTVTNSGTLPMDEIVSIDVLPHVDDTGVIVTLPRDSEWTPTFADTLTLISSTGTPIADITQRAFYSTSYEPCTDDLDPLDPPCPAGSWLPYDASVDPATVHSLKVELDFPDGELFAPGDAVTLQARTTTTPSEALASDFPVAWNTVATGAVSVDNGTRASVPETEGRKVGVTYPTGPIELEKTVSGAGSAYAPDTFDVHVTCTSAGSAVFDDDVTLTPGADPTEIPGLPWDAVCVATETDQGQTEAVIDPEDGVTVGDPAVDTLISIDNVFALGGLSVTKTVTSDAVDQDGNPITYGPFGLAASCEFLGDPVWADGYGVLNPMRTQLAAGDSWDLAGLPVGAECTVTEPDSADAADVTITPATVEIVEGNQPVQVGVENSYDVGSLHLRKLVEPAAVQQFPISQGPFTLHVTCTLTDASHPGGAVVYDDDVVLQGAQPLEATIDDIAAGAVCTVTEPDAGAATEHVITPRQVTIAADDTVNVVATNLFGESALTVTKTIDGAGAERYGAGPFQVSLSCSYTNAAGEQVPLDTPGGPTRELTAANGYTAQYEPLLFGSRCEVEETRTGGATTSVITDADGQEVSTFRVDSLTEDLQLQVTNTFDVGDIKVVKTVVGDGPSRFEVELACTQDVDGTETPVDIPGGADRVLRESSDFTTTYAGLPTGAECTLVETDDGDALETTITPNDGDPEVGAVTVGNGTTVKIKVKNKFDNANSDDQSGTGDDNNTAGGVPLPGTGADVPVWLAWLGLGLLAAGGTLTVFGVRRRRS